MLHDVVYAVQYVIMCMCFEFEEKSTIYFSYHKFHIQKPFSSDTHQSMKTMMSVGRKNLLYVKRMLPLFRAITNCSMKACTKIVAFGTSN